MDLPGLTKHDNAILLPPVVDRPYNARERVCPRIFFDSQLCHVEVTHWLVSYIRSSREEQCKGVVLLNLCTFTRTGVTY